MINVELKYDKGNYTMNAYVSSKLPWYEWHTVRDRLRAFLSYCLRGKKGYGMRLVPGQWGIGFCDMEKNYIQANPTYWGSTQNQQFLITKAVLNHEAGHARFSSLASIVNTSPALKNMFNLLEDYRIEWIMSQESIESEKLFLYLRKYLNNMTPPLSEYITKLGADNPELVIHMIFRWRLGKDPSDNQQLSDITKRRWKVVKPWIEGIPYCVDDMAVRVTSTKILDFLGIPYDYNSKELKELAEKLKEMLGENERKGNRNQDTDPVDKNPFGNTPSINTGGSSNGKTNEDTSRDGSASEKNSDGDSKDNNRASGGNTSKSTSKKSSNTSSGSSSIGGNEDKSETADANSQGTQTSNAEENKSGNEQEVGKGSGEDSDKKSTKEESTEASGSEKKEADSSKTNKGNVGKIKDQFEVPKGWESDKNLDKEALGFGDTNPQDTDDAETNGDGDNIDRHLPTFSPSSGQGGVGYGGDLALGSYAEILEDARPTAKAIVRKLKLPQPKASDTEDDSEGRFDVRNYISDRDTPFSVRNSKGKKAPTMAIHIVIDRSGSMGGAPILGAKLAAMVFYLVCEELKIPCAITCLEGIIKISEFDRPNNLVLPRIGGVYASGGTNTQPTMKYVEESLKKRNENIKQIVFIHDGFPNDPEAFKYWAKSLKNIQLTGVLLTDIYQAYSATSNNDYLKTTTDSLSKLFGEKNFIACNSKQLPERWCNMIKHKRKIS